MSIENDLAFYRQLLPDLIPTHVGQWVLIKDAQLIEIFNSNEEAYAAGVKQFGATPFLVREVTETEPVESL